MLLASWLACQPNRVIVAFDMSGLNWIGLKQLHYVMPPTCIFVVVMQEGKVKAQSHALAG